MFADDTNLFLNIATFFSTENIELEKISQWLDTNRLSLNVK